MDNLPLSQVSADEAETFFPEMYFIKVLKCIGLLGNLMRAPRSS